MECPYCKNSLTVKNGTDRERDQRYKCKKCGKTFMEKSIIAPEEKRLRRMAIYLMLSGCKITEIAKTLSVRKSAITRWRKLYLKRITELIRFKQVLPIEKLAERFSNADSGNRSNRGRAVRPLRKRR